MFDMTQSTIFLSTPSARRATVGEVPFTYLVLEFLSTPSARRATGAIHGGETFQWNFYPRPPRGGRRNAVNSVINFFKISIHALREEGDPADCRRPTPSIYFYPRPPRGGRLLGPAAPGRTKKFLSTPSARRATKKRGESSSIDKFLSTPSARRATGQGTVDIAQATPISIHALREEGDVEMLNTMKFYH